jgi:hypothetical protein
MLAYAIRQFRSQMVIWLSSGGSIYCLTND